MSPTPWPRTSPPCDARAPLGGAVLNVGTGRRISLLDLAAAINAALGTDLEPEFQPPRRGTSATRRPASTASAPHSATNRLSRSKRACAGPWPRPARNEEVNLFDQAEHSPARSRMAAWATGPGQDQTRKNSACRAHRWAGSVRRKPVPLRAVRYAWVTRRTSALAWLRIWPAAGRRARRGPRPSAIVQSRSQALADGLDRLDQLGPLRRLQRPGASSAARAWPSARAEVSRPPVPAGPECGHHVGVGPTRRSDSAMPTPSHATSRRARRLERASANGGGR